MSLLPTHPRNGLTALGFRKDGRPIWPIMGGSGEGEGDGGNAGDKSTEGGDGKSGAGDDGKKTADEGGKPSGDDFKSEESKRAVLADLAKEREERKALKAELDKLAPLAKLAEALAGDGKESGPTDIEKLTKEFQDHKDELAKERDLRWRAEVAAEKKLTPRQAARLVGTTKDELLADADEFLKDLPQQSEEDRKRPRGPVVDRSGTGDGTPGGGSLSAGAAAYAARKGKKTD